MRLKRLFASRRSSSLACVLLLLLCASGGARAQGQETEKARAPRTAAEKFDEFGDLRHCDLTARLDNFAIELQNETGAKGYVVGYAPPGGKAVDGRLRTWRFYLVEERGVLPEKLFFYNAGIRDDAADFGAELWLVPEGALPPVPLAALEEARKDFSGKLEAYQTSEMVYRELVEMGPSYEAVAMDDFAEKLKKQPDYKGYIVIRAAKDSLPGASERMARRERRRMQNDHGVEADRLATVDAGYTDDENSVVELWILPRNAPPPAGVSEKLERKMAEAFKLNALDYYDKPDDDEAEWVIENLAEALRRDPNARASIIIRERAPEAEESEGGDAAASPDEASTVTDELPPDAATGEGEKADAGVVAEQWVRKLTEKYGVEASRVQVMTGRPLSFGGARLEVWVAPPKVPLPDPFVVTRDEEAEEVFDESGEGAAEAVGAEPPPLF